MLDAGCGTAPMISVLSERFPNVNFTGIDLTPKMIEVAKSKNIPNATFVCGDCESLPFEKDSFDVIICSQSFHHYPYPEKAMREAWRVLKSGGLYILSDTGIGGVGAWIDNHILFKLARSGDCHTTNRKGIEKMRVGAGFTVVDSRQIRGTIYTVTGKKESR